MFINKNLIRFARNSKGLLVLACVYELLLTMIGSLISILCAFAVKMLLNNCNILFFSDIKQIFICAVICLALLYILARYKVLFSNLCSIEIRSELRKNLINKLFDLGPAFSSGKRTGDIANTISSKVEWLSYYYVLYLPAAISALMNSIILISILYSFNWIVASICLISCFCMFTCPLLFYHLMRSAGEREWAVHTTYYADCVDSIQGMTTLKALNANKRQREFIHKRGEELRVAVMNQLKVSMIENGVLELLARLGSAFSVAVSVIISISTGKDDMLIYILFIAVACFTPMLKLVNAWHMGYRGIIASDSIEQLLNSKAVLSLKAKDSESVKPIEMGDIVFENVSFAYTEEDGDVIHNLSMKIPEGSMVAIIGSSGGGKSTLAHLLAGFYPVREGSISIGNTIINEDTVASVQSMISAVWQDSHVFYGTVAENIRIGRPDASDKEIIEASKKANLHNFVSTLQDGYDTMLGENGIRFSGGERQRMALARAYLKNAPILIFDEATSSLDRKNEMEIQKSFAELRQGKTSMVIAHRLSTISQADILCILEKGRIVAYGPYEEISNNSPAYKSLMGRQLREE